MQAGSWPSELADDPPAPSLSHTQPPLSSQAHWNLGQAARFLHSTMFKQKCHRTALFWTPSHVASAKSMTVMSRLYDASCYSTSRRSILLGAASDATRQRASPDELPARASGSEGHASGPADTTAARRDLLLIPGMSVTSSSVVLRPGRIRPISAADPVGSDQSASAGRGDPGRGGQGVTSECRPSSDD